MDEALLTTKSTFANEDYLSDVMFNVIKNKQPSSSSRLTRSSLLLGFVTGIFIQLSTVGAYALTAFQLGHEYIGEHIFMLALLWSIVLCSLGLCTLRSTTGIIACYDINVRHCEKRNGNNYSNRVRTTVESRFLVGSLSSLSISYFLLSSLLEDQVRWDIGVLALLVVLLYWHAPKHCLDLGHDEDDQLEEENNDDIIGEDVDYKGEEV